MSYNNGDKYKCNLSTMKQPRTTWNCHAEQLKYITSTKSHEHIMTWKCFLHYQPFVRGTTSHQWIPPQRANNASFNVFLDFSLNKLSRSASDLRRYDAHGVVVMTHEITPSLTHQTYIFPFFCCTTHMSLFVMAFSTGWTMCTPTTLTGIKYINCASGYSGHWTGNT